jgi:hypothetical protein
MVLPVSLLPQPASAPSRDRDSERPLPNGARAAGAGSAPPSSVRRGKRRVGVVDEIHEQG